MIEDLFDTSPLVPVVIITIIAVKQIKNRIGFILIFIIMLGKVYVIFLHALKDIAVKTVCNDTAFRLCECRCRGQNQDHKRENSLHKAKDFINETKIKLIFVYLQVSMKCF